MTPCPGADGRFTGVLLTLAVLLLGVSVASAHGIPFTLVGDRYVVVEVAIGEIEGLRFVVDTASSITVITPRVAQRLKLPLEGTQSTLTQTGADAVPVARVPSLRLGRVEATDLRVLVTSLWSVSAVGCPVDGVLGQDVLGNWSYLLDYERWQLVLHRGSALGQRMGGIVVPLTVVDKRLVIDATITAEGSSKDVPVRLALDSAASSLMLFERADTGRGALKLHGPTDPVRLLSLHGSQMARKGRVDTLDIGGHLLRHLSATLARRPRGWLDHGQDGLLPTALFRAVYFDTEARQVVINPTFGSEGAIVTDDLCDECARDEAQRRPPSS